MSNLNKILPVSDASLGSLSAHRDPGSPPQGVIVEQPDVRLIIEEDEKTGSFVYKTMDRRTGQVIQQFPREEILRLKQEQQYIAGAVIDARA